MGFSRFEIITTTTAFYLCLGFVCVFLEASDMETELAVESRESAMGDMLWSATEADGQFVTLSGAVSSQDAKDKALQAAGSIRGVSGIADNVEVIADAEVCQSALNQRLSAGITFEAGRTELSEDSFAVLQDLANIAGQCTVPLEIAVHTGRRGDAEVNEKLSQRRADNIAKYLVGAGVPAEKLRASGLGERQPAHRDDDALNERVEIRVRGQLV